jgi:hypothetical protein
VTRRRKHWRRPRREATEQSPELETRAGGGRRGGLPRPTKLALLAGGVALVAVAAIIGAIVVLSRPEGAPGPPRALIVDQLYETAPNPDFLKAVGGPLEAAGYRVHYVPYQNVTVDFYRALGTEDFDIIILRAHVARLLDRVTKKLGDDAIFFTSEPYTDTKYVDEQLAKRVVWAAYQPGAERYFGVVADFFESELQGNLHGATVLLTGCFGLRSDTMARALVDKGAKAVVGWTDLVSPEHTDAATEQLIEHLVVDKLPLGEAVDRTMEELGPDPEYGSTLKLYPSERAAFVLP